MYKLNSELKAVEKIQRPTSIQGKRPLENVSTFIVE